MLRIAFHVLCLLSHMRYIYVQNVLTWATSDQTSAATLMFQAQVRDILCWSEPFVDLLAWRIFNT